MENKVLLIIFLVIAGIIMVYCFVQLVKCTIEIRELSKEIKNIDLYNTDTWNILIDELKAGKIKYVMTVNPEVCSGINHVFGYGDNPKGTEELADKDSEFEKKLFKYRYGIFLMKDKTAFVSVSYCDQEDVNNCILSRFNREKSKEFGTMLYDYLIEKKIIDEKGNLISL